MNYFCNTELKIESEHYTIQILNDPNKNIDAVIEDLIRADLIEVVATMKPIITYKVRKS